MLTVNHNGSFFAQVNSPDELQAMADFSLMDISELTIPANEIVAYEAQQRRLAIRADLPAEAGDTVSQLATVADNVGLLLEELGRFMALATTSADPVLAAAAQPLAGALAPLVAAIDAGEVCLTHHVKGTETVIIDACTRASAVSAVLTAHATP